MAYNKLMYQRKQSQLGGRSGAQQFKAGVGIGKANVR